MSVKTSVLTTSTN